MCLVEFAFKVSCMQREDSGAGSERMRSVVHWNGLV
jgi:hypothetical protein